MTVPSWSEPEPLNVTALPRIPDWSEPALATGERLTTRTTAVSLALEPRLSVIVSVAV